MTQQQQTLDEKRIFLQQQALDIIAIAELQSQSGLTCLHKIQVLGGTTEKAYKAVQQRILTDNDPHSAYHAIAMAQQTADLPFDVPLLIDVVLQQGTADLWLKTLKLFKQQPAESPPIPELQQAIINTGDTQIIQQMNTLFKGR